MSFSLADAARIGAFALIYYMIYFGYDQLKSLFIEQRGINYADLDQRCVHTLMDMDSQTLTEK